MRACMYMCTYICMPLKWDEVIQCYKFQGRLIATIWKNWQVFIKFEWEGYDYFQVVEHFHLLIIQIPVYAKLLR